MRNENQKHTNAHSAIYALWDWHGRQGVEERGGISEGLLFTLNGLSI